MLIDRLSPSTPSESKCPRSTWCELLGLWGGSGTVELPNSKLRSIFGAEVGLSASKGPRSIVGERFRLGIRGREDAGVGLEASLAGTADMAGEWREVPNFECRGFIGLGTEFRRGSWIADLGNRSSGVYTERRATPLYRDSAHTTRIEGCSERDSL